MQATTPDQFPTAEMFGEIVEVRTSDSGSFFLHRGALKFYSGYFAGALKEDAFKEGREGVIDLPSSTKLIRKFVHWMYTRQLSRGAIMRGKLALFAVEHHVPMLLNMLMDAIHDDFVQTGQIKINVTDVYEHTVGQPNTPDALPIPESYKLRQFAISMMCVPNQEMHTFMPWIDRWWPKDAVGDLLLARSRWSDSGKSKNFSPIQTTDVCELHHTHNKGEQCHPRSRPRKRKRGMSDESPPLVRS